MSKDIVIAVDVMGGDHGPAVVVPGAVAAARENGFSLALVGDEAKVYPELEKLNCSDIDAHVVHATQVAEMHDKPSEVLRRKRTHPFRWHAGWYAKVRRKAWLVPVIPELLWPAACLWWAV